MSDINNKDDFFEEWGKCSDALEKYAWKLTQNPHNADDLFRDAYIKAHDKWPPETRQNLCGWFRSIVHNEFIDETRRQNRAPVSYFTTVGDSQGGDYSLSLQDLLVDTKRPVPGNDEFVGRLVFEALLEVCKQDCPAELGLFIQHYYEGQTVTDLAASTERSEHEIKTDLARAAASLRLNFSEQPQNTEDQQEFHRAVDGTLHSMERDLPEGRCDSGVTQKGLERFRLYVQGADWDTALSMAEVAERSGVSAPAVHKTIAPVRKEFVRRFTETYPELVNYLKAQCSVAAAGKGSFKALISPRELRISKALGYDAPGGIE